MSFRETDFAISTTLSCDGHYLYMLAGSPLARNPKGSNPSRTKFEGFRTISSIDFGAVPVGRTVNLGAEGRVKLSPKGHPYGCSNPGRGMIFRAQAIGVRYSGTD